MTRRDFLTIATVSPLILLSKEANAFGFLPPLLAFGEFVLDCFIANTERTLLFSGLALVSETAAAAGIISRASAISRLNRGISVIGGVEKVAFRATEMAIKRSARSQIEKERMLNVLKIGETTIDVVTLVAELEAVNPNLADHFVDAVNTKKVSAVWKTGHNNSIVVPFENKSNHPLSTSFTVTLKDVETGEHEVEKSFLLKAEPRAMDVYSLQFGDLSYKQGLKQLVLNITSHHVKSSHPKFVFMV